MVKFIKLTNKGNNKMTNDKTTIKFEVPTRDIKGNKIAETTLKQVETLLKKNADNVIITVNNNTTFYSVTCDDNPSVIANIKQQEAVLNQELNHCINY